jgi:hypothetical protein
MEFSSLTLCLCITIAAASYSHGHLLHVSASSKALPQPHVAKRQTNQDDVCNDVLARSVCTNGYYEDYAYIATQCFQRSAAKDIQDACSRNSMGTLYVLRLMNQTHFQFKVPVIVPLLAATNVETS